VGKLVVLGWGLGKLAEMTLDFFKKEPKISPILYHFHVIFDSLAKKFRNLAFLTALL
jgi:hypothetical protein